jgi:hypothetical protein
MGKKKKKVVEEEPLVVKIYAPLAYVSGMDALAHAQQFALQREDAGQMIEIANAWIELGNQLLTHGVELVYSDGDNDPAASIGSGPGAAFGFTGGVDHGEETESSSDSPEG